MTDMHTPEPLLDVTPAGIKGGQGRTGEDVEGEASLLMWGLAWLCAVILGLSVGVAVWALGANWFGGGL